jgi:ABC-type Fe3+-hydroxamate transport system substrate-binding protein
MAQSKYRKELDNYITDIALEDVGSERIAPENAHEVLNHIEDRVNAIKDKLENIKGLTEIDEIYDMVNELSDDLY